MNRRKFLIGSGSTLAAPFIHGQPPRPRILIGQIGLSHPHALGKLTAIRSLEDTFELVGVVEPNPKLRQKVKGVKFISVEELMNTPALETVAIETRVSDLVSTALPVVNAGKHIHLDKPAGPTLAPFKKLLEAAERQNLTVQMGYMLRYNPAFAFMFRAARENWFGEIMEIDAMMGKKAGVGMRSELAEFDGGGFFELACHILDAAVHLLGKPKMVRGFNLRTRHKEGDSFADNQLAVLEYEKATACLRCNHNDPFGGPRRRFNISGTRGGMEIQPLESGKFILNLDKARDDYRKGSQVVKLKGGRSYVPEFVDLARAIRGEKKLDWSYEHDLTVHHTLLRICGMA
jgi:predicted dehydrogenase